MSMESYNPSDFGDQEVALRNTFILQMYDARNYFLNVTKPRLDRSYKLYIAYTGDRQREIKRWQSNIFVPYVMAAVETLMPRILDARPDFTAQGRSNDDQLKTEKQQQLMDYLWEISKMDSTNEMVVRSSLVYGTGFLQVSWKKDVRKYKFLDTKDLLGKKYKYTEKERTFYDAPYCEWVDNYQLWYDWHNTLRENKQYWFKRLVISEPEIRRRYPNADKKRLQMGLNGVGGDLNDYASVRNLVKSNHQFILKGFAPITSYRGIGDDKYQVYSDPKLRMYEVFEWWRPFEDAYTVMVGNNYVPIFKGGAVPIPYDFKEAPFIEVPYLKLPYEFEGYGLPMILENPQIMLNLIKNQRLDSATLSIHKMWIVNPLANINKEELVTRPFGIIYSIDPNGVREVQFSDIKQSAYREEDLLKQDMRYSSGVDDFSMGAGGTASSATEVRHLRESTLERVRMFVNHLGDAYSDLMRYWMDMQRQFFTKTMQIRIIGDDGQVQFPLVEKDDLRGQFDYKATVLPSIAGQMDVKRKQDMDLFQLLVTLPFVDPKKLTSKVLPDFGWNLDSISTPDQGQGAQQLGPDGQPLPAAPGGAASDMTGQPPMDMSAMAGAPASTSPSGLTNGGVPPQVLMNAMKMLGANAAQATPPSGFNQANLPINLLQAGPPPTVAGAGGGPGYSPYGKTANPRGLNRTGKLNLNTANRDGNSNPESELLKNVHNLQRKK
jgi:hypothetical protein